MCYVHRGNDLNAPLLDHIKVLFQWEESTEQGCLIGSGSFTRPMFVHLCDPDANNKSFQCFPGMFVCKHRMFAFASARGKLLGVSQFPIGIKKGIYSVGKELPTAVCTKNRYIWDREKLSSHMGRQITRIKKTTGGSQPQR